MFALNLMKNNKVVKMPMCLTIKYKKTSVFERELMKCETKLSKISLDFIHVVVFIH